MSTLDTMGATLGKGIEYVYSCETFDRMFWQRDWVDKRKFKGALLSDADDSEDAGDIVRLEVVHGWAICVLEEEGGWCGNGGPLVFLLAELPRTETGYWTDDEGERREVIDGPHRATFARES